MSPSAVTQKQTFKDPACGTYWHAVWLQVMDNRRVGTTASYTVVQLGLMYNQNNGGSAPYINTKRNSQVINNDQVTIY